MVDKSVSSSIAQGTVIRGSIRGDGDLEIHGRVEGSIEIGGDLLIADGALIKSDVSGRRVIVRGAIAGNVHGTESLVLEPGARVVGDLTSPSIGIRPGALVRGNISTDPGTERPVAVRRPAVATQSRAAAAPARSAAPTRPAARPAPIAAPAPTNNRAPISAPISSTAATEKKDAIQTAPPPVVPTLKKGAKAQLRRKSAR